MNLVQPNSITNTDSGNGSEHRKTIAKGTVLNDYQKGFIAAKENHDSRGYEFPSGVSEAWKDGFWRFLRELDMLKGNDEIECAILMDY